MRKRLLGVLLCYNDGDILAEAIEHLLDNNHDLIVWNHGSTDNTADVLRQYTRQLREVTHVDRSVDFYDLYPLMSKHLLSKYVNEYDWISWPDQDEFLEGASRERRYCTYVETVLDSPFDWIEFRDYVYWHTPEDDVSNPSACDRVRCYSLARHGVPKIRAWRASTTNIRWFNHNRTEGSRYPELFNLRHYPMRTAAQMTRRLSNDRVGIRRGPLNGHYEHMWNALQTITIRRDDLHYDDRLSELDPTMKFDWSDVYGRPQAVQLPNAVRYSYVLSSKRWHITAIAQQFLGTMLDSSESQIDHKRISLWQRRLGQRPSSPIVIALERNNVRIVTESLANRWAQSNGSVDVQDAVDSTRTIEAIVDGRPISVSGDAEQRRLRIQTDKQVDSSHLLLLPWDGKDVPRLTRLNNAAAEFESLMGNYYFLIIEPPGWLEDEDEIAGS